MSVQVRPFGTTGLQVSEIGFGGSRLGGVFAASKGGEDAVTVLRQALDAGITFFDTADMYSQGESETLIGKAFKGKRDKVVIASKGGYCLPAQRKLMARIKPLARPIARALGIKRESLPASVSGELSQNFTPAYLTQALDASLKRLGTDYLDVYQLHSPSAATIQSNAFAETLQTLEMLKRQGKIRIYGIAADTPEDARIGLQYDGISSVQFPFGLLDLEALDGVFEAAQQRGVGVIARGCFGGGLLKESLTPEELQAQTPKWKRILALREFATQSGHSILETALKFCLAVPSISTTLLGMRTPAHLQTNLKYYAAAPLSESDFRALLEISN
jgi:aryl-alcohol dehydrogenase-like predicted oxidoreductase